MELRLRKTDRGLEYDILNDDGTRPNTEEEKVDTTVAVECMLMCTKFIESALAGSTRKRG